MQRLRLQEPDNTVWTGILSMLTLVIGFIAKMLWDSWHKPGNGNGNGKKPVQVQLDQESRDILRNLEFLMAHHNRISEDSIKKLDAILMGQAEERGRHGG